MIYSTRLLVLIATTGLSSLPHSAIAQTAPVAAPAAAPAPAPVAATPAPVAAAPAPVAAPSPAPLPVPPPGYMLVPAGTNYAVAAAPPKEQDESETELPYEEGQPIPAGYHLEEHVRRGLIIGGSIPLGIAWVFSAMGAVADDYNHKSGFLMVPGIGPWLMLAAGGASDDCSPTSSDYCESNSGLRSVLFLDGLTQTAGAVMLITGLAYPKKQLVRNNVAISFAPTPIGREGYGLGAIGTF